MFGARRGVFHLVKAAPRRSSRNHRRWWASLDARPATLVEELKRTQAKPGARWIRDFVTQHPAYAKDSRVTDEIAKDLAVAAHEIGIGARDATELTGGVKVREVSPDGAWAVRLKPDKIPTADERRALLARYARRIPFQGDADLDLES